MYKQRDVKKKRNIHPTARTKPSPESACLLFSSQDCSRSMEAKHEQTCPLKRQEQANVGETESTHTKVYRPLNPSERFTMPKTRGAADQSVVAAVQDYPVRQQMRIREGSPT